MQLELSFDSEVIVQADGSYLVRPGKLVARKAEDWRYMHEVAQLLPYVRRQRNVSLIKEGAFRGRQRIRGGWWEVELNSLRAYLKRIEEGRGR